MKPEQITTGMIDAPRENSKMKVTGRNLPESYIVEVATFEKFLLYELEPNEQFHPEAVMAIALKLQELSKENTKE